MTAKVCPFMSRPVTSWEYSCDCGSGSPDLLEVGCIRERCAAWQSPHPNIERIGAPKDGFCIRIWGSLF